MTVDVQIDTSKYSFRDSEKPVFKTPKGLSEAVVREISRQHDEPAWMLELRLKALEIFLQQPMPEWGADLSDIDFDDLHYYIRPSEHQSTNWDDVPEYIKNTFDRLGIPQAERKFLAGVGAQYESEVVYHNLKKKWTDLGVVFCDMSEAPKLYPDLVKKYFASVVPLADNKFAALNSAV